MGVYIKGMEMQSRCTVCVLCERWRYKGTRNLVCVPADRLIPEDCDERPDWCPMIEVHEPHGRLIDADALIKGSGVTIQITGEENARVVAEALESIYQDIEEAPTIIGAVER